MGRSESMSFSIAFAPATALPDFHDPYLDPQTGLLRNRLGVTSAQSLDAAEADYGLVRTLELLERPVKVTGDLRQLTALHGRLFQDVYDWRQQGAAGARCVSKMPHDRGWPALEHMFE